MSSVINALSVDVEDYYQVSAFEKIISRDEWSNYSSRVEFNTNKVLDLFDEHNVKATFFVLGIVAECYPQLIHRIIESGHELASHGYDHSRVTSQTKETFFRDVSKSKYILEDVSGKQILGYRAPSYSITTETTWAYEVLGSLDFKYSSSVYPVKHDLYGIPDSSRFPFIVPSKDYKLLEIPISTVKFMGRNIHCGGGGFFRLYPYFLSRLLINRVNCLENQPCIFYFHPWELDPKQPKIQSASLKSKFRHYLNLERMEGRLKCLLTDFQWDRIDNVYKVN